MAEEIKESYLCTTVCTVKCFHHEVISDCWLIDADWNCRNEEMMKDANLLKVSKFQKQIFLFSFEPKNERNYFLISALASKNGSNQKNEGTLFISIRGDLIQ